MSRHLGDGGLAGRTSGNWRGGCGSAGMSGGPTWLGAGAKGDCAHARSTDPATMQSTTGSRAAVASSARVDISAEALAQFRQPHLVRHHRAEAVVDVVG